MLVITFACQLLGDGSSARLALKAFEVFFSMEVIGLKLVMGLMPQQIYLFHGSWGLLLEASP
jgi:hypothetical protein